MISRYYDERAKIQAALQRPAQAKLSGQHHLSKLDESVCEVDGDDDDDYDEPTGVHHATVWTGARVKDRIVCWHLSFE